MTKCSLGKERTVVAYISIILGNQDQTQAGALRMMEVWCLLAPSCLASFLIHPSAAAALSTTLSQCVAQNRGSLNHEWVGGQQDPQEKNVNRRDKIIALGGWQEVWGGQEEATKGW